MWFKTNEGLLINLSQVQYLERKGKSIFIGFKWYDSEHLEDTYNTEDDAEKTFKKLHILLTRRIVRKEHPFPNF